MVKSVLLLSVAFAAAFLEITTTTAQPSENPNVVNVSLFYADIGQIDDRVPSMTTNQFIIYMLSNSKEHFRVGLLLPNGENKSETDYWYDWSHNENSSGLVSQQWNDSTFSWWNEKTVWNLYSYGVFPNDTFVWPMLIGSNRNLTAWSEPVQLTGNFPTNITTKWVMGYPYLIPFSNLDNATLSKLWPTFDWKQYLMAVNGGIKIWDFIAIRFSREPADIIRFTALFWVPSAGLLGVYFTTWVLCPLISRPKRTKFRVNRSDGLLIYLSSALFAIPFIATINQYAPPFQISLVEILLYVDAGLGFLSAIALLLRDALLGEHQTDTFDTKSDQPTPSNIGCFDFYSLVCPTAFLLALIAAYLHFDRKWTLVDSIVAMGLPLAVLWLILSCITIVHKWRIVAKSK